MKQAIDKWTMTASFVLVVGALLACKKKTDEPAPAASVATPPAVSIAPLPVTSAAPIATAAAVAVDAGVAAPVLGDVKRFPDKEKPASGAVKVTVDNSLVYDEPDDKTPSVASLTKDIFVERLATLGSDWILVDFPSGVGKLSPGWLEAKSLGEQVTTVTKAKVAAQTTTATLASGAKPLATAPPAVSAKSATTAAVAATAPAAATAPTATPVRVKPQMLARPKP
jgi:hypothetical protein